MGNILSPESGPLFHAIAEGDVDAAVRAVEAHPGLSHKRAGKKSRTIYHACASIGQVAILRRLCEHVWQNMPDEMGKMHAPDVLPEDRFHPTIYRAVNSYDECGLTPLMLSCRKGHAGAVQFLLSQGADPWIGDRLMGRSALHHASRADHAACIQAILSSPFVGAMGKVRSKDCKLVDFPNNSGYTPLHYAAASRTCEAAALLLNLGANPNAKTFEVGFDFIQLDRGSTPLHAAARFQNLDLAVLILKHWDENLRRRDVTDPRVVDNYERIMPYQLAGVKLNKALARVLDPSTPIREISDGFGDTDSQSGKQFSKHPYGIRYNVAKAGSFSPPSVNGVCASKEPQAKRPMSGDVRLTSEEKPAGWEDLMSPKSAIKLQGWNGSGEVVTVYRCAESSHDTSASALPPPATDWGAPQRPSTSRRLFRTQSDSRNGNHLRAQLGSSTTATSPVLTRTRSSAVVPTGSYLFSNTNGHTSSDEDVNGRQLAGRTLRHDLPTATGTTPISPSAPSLSQHPSCKSPSATGMVRLSEMHKDASTLEVPFRESTPGSLGGGGKGGREMDRLLSDWQMPSMSPLQPITPPRGDMIAGGGGGGLRASPSVERAATGGCGGTAAGGGSYVQRAGAVTGSGGSGLARTVSDPAAALVRPPSPTLVAKPRSPESNTLFTRALSRSASKKLIPNNGTATVSAPDTPAPPPVISAWGEKVPNKALRVGGMQPPPPPQQPQELNFTRDSHAEDAQPVQLTMFPYVMENVQRVRAGETNNVILDEGGGGRPRQQ